MFLPSNCRLKRKGPTIIMDIFNVGAYVDEKCLPSEKMTKHQMFDTFHTDAQH